MSAGSPQHWLRKFHAAFRGCSAGIIGQSSFLVHLPAASVVLMAASILQVARWEWCLLVLCITLVIVAEMANSALETLAQSITSEHHPEIGRALDTSAAAVLIAAVGSSVVGAVIFTPYFWRLIYSG
jgi:diacylglycerol kinase